MRRGAILLAAVVIVVVPWATTAWAQARGPETPADLVILSGDAVVPQGRVVGQVVVFTGSASIAGVVRGDVVVFDGPVTVAGQVSGDVVALDGAVRLLATAQVGGSVLGGGAVTVVQGATVGGQVRQGVSYSLSDSTRVLGVLLASAAMAVSILIAGLFLLLFAPRGADRVADAGRSAPFASVGWGLLLVIVIPLTAIAAAATIIGLPFGLAVLLGLGVLWLVGQTWLTYTIGRLLVREPRSRVGALFAGWGIGAAIGLVPFLNVAWWGLGSVFGIGAMTVAAWRARRGSDRPAAPAPRAGKGGRHAAGRTTVPVASEPDAA